jgi:uncharacterized protein with von Willebrand factor type A (vWA) domain
MSEFRVETIELDLPALAGAFARRLHDAGVPVTPERAARLAQALTLTAPVSRRRLYWTARAALVTDPTQVRAFDAVFRAVFGSGATPGAPAPPDARQLPVDGDDRPVEERERTRRSAGSAAQPAGAPAPSRSDAGSEEQREVAVPALASAEELLRAKRFDALEAGELAELYRLMSRLRIATPSRRTRRAERDRHGERTDLRRTLRRSMRTGGDPIRLSRRRRRVVQRRLVLLCDISGSMEPYARAYLQFLTCAAGSGPQTEAFAFATRLTRLTRALASRNPERAIQRAAVAAPDWSSGTRLGDALKTFNDRHGRRGMARGAIVVILSDGWERGDPALVAREMQRLARLAYRIVWVNPRVSASGFAPRAGGMAAALSYCDALVSGHNLAALDEVVEAIGSLAGGELATWTLPEPEPAIDADDEPWGSATPVPGSSIAMPSGYGPSRGHTTPGWSR